MSAREQGVVERRAPGESRLRILFEPFREEKESFLFDEGTADVPAQITLYFGDADDDGSLALAEKLISAFRKGEGASIDVEGCLTIYHDDEELPPTPFDADTAPDWLQRVIDTYRKNGGPALLEELRRLEGLVYAITAHEPDSAFDEEQNEARADARVAQDFVLGSRKLMRERLDAAADALKHYAKGADGDRAQQTLAFIEQQ